MFGAAFPEKCGDDHRKQGRIPCKRPDGQPENAAVGYQREDIGQSQHQTDKHPAEQDLFLFAHLIMKTVVTDDVLSEHISR